MSENTQGTWVKVCGLTRRDDVLAAAAAGADAVGFVVAPSPRRVAVAEVRELGADLPCLRVIVTVDTPPEALLRAAEEAGADGVQPHGLHAAEAAAAAHAAGLFVIRPVPVDGEPIDLSGVGDGQVPLLDTRVPGLHGGTGEPFDWGLTASLDRRFILAGGLGPENVAAAIRAAHPWGVDASTALEFEPGLKDPARIEAFVRNAKG